VTTTHTYTHTQTVATLSVEAKAEMAHRLHSWQTKCNRLHGHSWTLRLFVKGRTNHHGIVVDFGALKRELNTVIDAELDHYTLIHADDPLAGDLKSYEGVRLVDFQPTSENLCRYLYDRFRSVFSTALQVAVEVSETCTSNARVGF
jgi:6-pyruvoyltetrahydropterin/6-carboxytetrahydropterin synthase